jgi:hypothetical protein
MAGIGALAGIGIGIAVKDSDYANEVADSIGASHLSGQVTNAIFGKDGDLVSSFGTISRWAATGAVIGSVVPVVGTIGGGLIGAALGTVATLLSNWVGFDNIMSAVDGVFDKIEDVTESILGVDVQEAEERLSKMKEAESANREQRTALESAIAADEAEIERLRRAGNERDANILAKRNEDRRIQIGQLDSQLEMLNERQAKEEADIEWSKKTWLEKAGSLSYNLISYLTMAPLRILENLVNLSATALGFEDFDLSETLASIRDRTVQSIKNAVTRGFDFVSEMLSKITFDNLTGIAQTFVDKVTGFFDWATTQAWDYFTSIPGVQSLIDWIGGDEEPAKTENDRVTQPNPMLYDQNGNYIGGASIAIEQPMTDYDDSAAVQSALIEEYLAGLPKESGSNVIQSKAEVNNMVNTTTNVFSHGIGATEHADPSIAGVASR